MVTWPSCVGCHPILTGFLAHMVNMSASLACRFSGVYRTAWIFEVVSAHLWLSYSVVKGRWVVAGDQRSSCGRVKLRPAGLPWECSGGALEPAFLRTSV